MDSPPVPNGKYENNGRLSGIQAPWSGNRTVAGGKVTTLAHEPASASLTSCLGIFTTAGMLRSPFDHAMKSGAKKRERLPGLALALLARA
jgi:hypothetical protein